MVSQGDIVIVDFDPSLGHEQKGKRPAIVVSNNTFHARTLGLAILAPITSSIRNGFPLHVTLDNRTITQGQIMCEQLKTMDVAARNLRIVEQMPPDLLDRVLKIIRLEF